MKVSYSKYSTYKQCPFKYKAHYIDGLAAKYEKETPALFLGNLVHDTLYKFYQIKNPEERTLEKMNDIFESMWRDDVFTTQTERDEYYNRGKDMLARFYEKEDKTSNPISLEEYFEVQLGEHTINGFIDRVDKADDGVEIIDYKTGRYVPSQQEVDEDMQLTFYYIGYTNKHKEEPKKLSLYFLDKGVKRITTRTKKDLKNGLKEIKRTINRIETDRDFKPTPNKFCQWCDYAILCPAKSIGKNDKEKFNHIVSNLYLINNMSRYFTSILDIDELYEVIVNKFQSIAKAHLVSLMLFDDKKEFLYVEKSTGMSDKEIRDFKIRVGEGIAGLTALTGNHIYVKDVWKDKRYIPAKKESVKIPHPLVAIPIQYHDETIGVINIERGENEEFFENDLILFKNLAINASTAIMNARFYNDLDIANKKLDTRLNNITTLYKVSRIVNTSRELDEILNLSLEVAATGFGVEVSGVFLKNSANAYVCRAAYGIEQDKLAAISIKSDDPIVSIIGTVESAAEWADFKGADTVPEDIKAQFEKVYVVPLKAADEIRGIIVLFKLAADKQFDSEMETLINIFSLQIAPIIGMGQLIEKAKKDIADPFSPLVSAIDEEIAKVREYELNLDLILIRLKNYKDYIEKQDFEGLDRKIKQAEKEIRSSTIAIERIMRAEKDSFLDILPANSEIDISERIEKLNELGADYQISSMSYPQDGVTGVELINKLLTGMDLNSVPEA